MGLKIIGTSHIAEESIEEIKTILAGEVDIVAVELDVQRAMALMEKKKSKIRPAEIFKIGVAGFLFVKLGQLTQKKLGKMVGVNPGTEMKTALILAQKKKLQVALIDQPIQITLKKFSQALTLREVGRFFFDMASGLFFPKRQMKKLGFCKFDLRKVPKKEVIEKMIDYVKGRFPSVYKTLIDDRNRYMVRKLVKLLRAYPGKEIVAIVGAGHVKGMEKLLLKVDVIK